MARRGFLARVAIVVSILSTLFSAAYAHAASKAAIGEAYGKLPLHFEENRGQADPRARYLARTPGGSVLIAPHELALGAGTESVRLTFERAASGTRLEALDALDGRVNYLVGNDPARWRTGLKTFARVRAKGMY